MIHFRMLRTLSYALALIGWLKLIGGAALAVVIFIQPTIWNIQIPHLMGSAPITALAIFALSVFVAIILIGASEGILWMLAVHERLRKIEEVFAKAK